MTEQPTPEPDDVDGAPDEQWEVTTPREVYAPLTWEELEELGLTDGDEL